GELSCELMPFSNKREQVKKFRKLRAQDSKLSSQLALYRRDTDGSIRYGIEKTFCRVANSLSTSCIYLFSKINLNKKLVRCHLEVCMNKSDWLGNGSKRLRILSVKRQRTKHLQLDDALSATKEAIFLPTAIYLMFLEKFEMEGLSLKQGTKCRQLQYQLFCILMTVFGGWYLNYMNSRQETMEVDINKKTENQAKMTKLSME
ncbi:hypothetical protein Tco_1224226, partial [Tanacetum coccineum]